MRLKDITVGVDFDTASSIAAQHALNLAKWCDANVSLLHAFRSPVLDKKFVVQLESDPSRPLDEVLLDRANDRLVQHIADLEVPEGIQLSVGARVAKPAEALVEHARERASDLIVVGTNERSILSRAFLGSVSEKTVRLADRPVLVARTRAGKPKRILVALDLSEASADVLAQADAWARHFGADLRVMTAYDPVSAPLMEHFQLLPRLEDVRKSGQALLDKFVQSAQVAEQHLVGATVEFGRTTDAILAAADDFGADLIVVGSHGRRGAPRFFLGSIAASVLRRANESVLVVRGPADA